jgi:hypothetical protein
VIDRARTQHLYDEDCMFVGDQLVSPVYLQDGEVLIPADASSKDKAKIVDGLNKRR